MYWIDSLMYWIHPNSNLNPNPDSDFNPNTDPNHNPNRNLNPNLNPNLQRWIQLIKLLIQYTNHSIQYTVNYFRKHKTFTSDGNTFRKTVPYACEFWVFFKPKSQNLVFSELEKWEKRLFSHFSIVRKPSSEIFGLKKSQNSHA